MRKIFFINIIFSCLAQAQFGEIKVVFDNRMLKVHEQQNVLPLKDDIVRFATTTHWDDDYSDLKIPLHFHFIFEGTAQKGGVETLLAQVLISSGTDQRYFDKSVQFPYSQSGILYFDRVLFDPLSSFLAFYINLILAGEIDTYEPLSGTRIYELCQEIALRGIDSEYSRGWSERIKLVDDLSTNFGLRKAKFAYYYAMDLFTNGAPKKAVSEFKNMVKGLNEVYDYTPREHYTLLFLKVHAKELSATLRLLGQNEIIKEFIELDPDNTSLYKQALN